MLNSPRLAKENEASSNVLTILPEPNLGKTPPLSFVFLSLEYCLATVLKIAPFVNLEKTSSTFIFPLAVVSAISM